MRLMKELIELLNHNQGFFSALLSVLSLIVSALAIWITVSTNKRQLNLQIFNERYEIYNRFYELLSLSMNIVHSSLTYKGKMIIWNTDFFGLYSENSKIGVELVKLDSAMESIDPKSEEYKRLNEKHNTMATEKFFTDYGLFLRDKTLLNKSKLLFSAKVVSAVNDFLSVYGEIVFSANFVDKDTMEDLFFKLKIVCDDIERNNTLEEMEKSLMIK